MSEDYVTNGNMLNKAIREHDTRLQEEMQRRFKEWCTENKESTYSAEANRRWKAKRFYV